MKIIYGVQNVETNSDRTILKPYFKLSTEEEFKRTLTDQKRTELDNFIKSMSIARDKIEIILLAYRPVRAIYNGKNCVKLEKMYDNVDTRICLGNIRIQDTTEGQQCEYMIPSFVDQICIGHYFVDACIDVQIEQIKPLDVMNDESDEAGFLDFVNPTRCRIKGTRVFMFSDFYIKKNKGKTLDLSRLLTTKGIDYASISDYWSVITPDDVVETAVKNNSHITLGDCSIGYKDKQRICLDDIAIDKIVDGHSTFNGSKIKVPDNYNIDKMNGAWYKNYEIYQHSHGRVAILDINNFNMQNLQNAEAMFCNAYLSTVSYGQDVYKVNEYGDTVTSVGYWDVQQYEKLNMKNCFAYNYFSELYVNLGDLRGRDINIEGMIQGLNRDVKVDATNITGEQIMDLVYLLDFRKDRNFDQYHTVDFRNMTIDPDDHEFFDNGMYEWLGDKQEIRHERGYKDPLFDSKYKGNQLVLLVSRDNGWDEDFLNYLVGAGFFCKWEYSI